LRFWGGGLEATYAVHLRLIGKRVVDFVSTEFFSLGVIYGSDATSEYRLKIGVFAQTGPVWPKISGTAVSGHPPPTNFLVRKL